MADARGTIGFIAPEVFYRGFGVVSTKSDVYTSNGKQPGKY
jgi:serine/threonine protein kinase